MVPRIVTLSFLFFIFFSLGGSSGGFGGGYGAGSSNPWADEDDMANNMSVHDIRQHQQNLVKGMSNNPSGGKY